MIKVIALDLDGTLLTDDKKVTPENKKAIQLAKEQGVKIVLCTGRPLMSIYHLLEELFKKQNHKKFYLNKVILEMICNTAMKKRVKLAYLLL